LLKIKVVFTNTEKEYGDALRFYYGRSLKTKIDVTVSIGLICFAITKYLLWGYSETTLYTFAIGAIFLGLLFFLNYVLPKIHFRQQPKFREQYRLWFSDEGISFKTNSVDSMLKWTHYHEVWEGPKFFLLIYGKAAFSIIPKRVFVNKDQENAFRTLLEKHVKFTYVKEK
jgi:hypothetical protein